MKRSELKKIVKEELSIIKEENSLGFFTKFVDWVFKPLEKEAKNAALKAIEKDEKIQKIRAELKIAEDRLNKYLEKYKKQ